MSFYLTINIGINQKHYMHLCKIKYLKRKDDMESRTTKIYTISITVDLIIRSRKTLSTFKNSNIYNITVKKFGKQKSIFMLYV